MLPYSRGLILDNTNNYGIVKTETVFGFAPKSDNLVNKSTEPLQWIFSQGDFGHRSLPDSFTSLSEPRLLNKEVKTTPRPQTLQKRVQEKSKEKKKKKTSNRKPKKHHKCIFKVIKKGKKNKSNKMKMKPMQKYIMPLILGLLAAKSFLIPIALKALAFLSAKGLMMGFFSTVMASVLSLKGMFERSQGYQNRKDDTKTQVEIIQVPSKSEDHVYYDNHYKRGDLIPAILNSVGYNEHVMS